MEARYLRSLKKNLEIRRAPFGYFFHRRVLFLRGEGFVGTDRVIATGRTRPVSLPRWRDAKLRGSNRFKFLDG